MKKDSILEILSNVSVPNIGQNVMTLGWLKNIRIEGNQVYCDLTIPMERADIKDDLNFSLIGAIQDKFPSADVHIHFTTSMMDNSAPAKDLGPISGVKNIIAVGSGKGGVGKSTVSMNLALGLKSLGASVGILDADLYGPSIPTMLGIGGERPKVKIVSGKNMIVPIKKYGIHAMSIGLVVDPEQAVVLRGPRLAGIIKQFFNECAWPKLDYLIVDLPPGTGDIQLTMVQTVPVTGAIMVTTPQEVAYADALKAMNMFKLEQIQVPVIGVVENMSWFSPIDMPDKRYQLFGEGGGKRLAKVGNTVLLGQVPLIQGIREGSDIGEPIMTLKEHPGQEYFLNLAKNTARQTAIRNESIDPTKAVNIQ
ncbi:MAG TPA: Mrp/NBP35 family ATP-binding protein [Bacteroidales bacterium]|nr:Mrp/NBP35 family ATP-binding protein [Bacteroidales bacterium]